MLNRFFDNERQHPKAALKSKRNRHRFAAAICFTLSFLTLTTAAQAQTPQVWGSASPSTIQANTQTTTLSWGSTGATSCESGGNAFPTSGSIVDGPFPTGTYSINFSCTGPGGTAYGTVTWTAVTPPPAPTLNSFTLSPNPVLTTQPIYLAWSSTNATSCTAAGGNLRPVWNSYLSPRHAHGRNSFILDATRGSRRVIEYSVCKCNG